MNDLEHIAIDRLIAASEMSLQHYEKPLVVCISGGKDSSVITELAIRAGIPVEFMHNHTTADAPETVRFVRAEFKRLEELGYQCTINMPTYKGKRVSMWSLIPQKLMPPTRLVRYCCSILKEKGGTNRFICTGVRWDESKERENTRGIYEKNSIKKKKRIILNNDNDDRRMLFENCRLQGKRTVNPIIDWKTNDVYDFLSDAKCQMNPLYSEEFSRVGCVGCPLSGKKRNDEFRKWPAYKRMYMQAFEKMIQERKIRGKKDALWLSPYDVFNWWMEYDILPGQMEMTDFFDGG